MPPFSSPHNQVPYPALYLYPLNDSFIPKHISLINNQRVKIGRQTNAKTVPAERNGYFDSKVLSRQHAEVWEEGGKIFIKDVKSSNGTFINGERLSPEGVESEPFELKTDDIVEFGIDIVGEDNKTIVHHKVAARVVCVFSDQDAQAAARAEAQQSPSSYGALGVPGPSGAAGAFSFAPGTAGAPNGMPGGAPRRSAMQPQGLVGMGGMGGNARPPGKSGLTFDHILSRLQGELQKSRETGSELHSLQGAMSDIHETLGGNIPANVASFPQTLPPVVPPQAQQPAEPSAPAPAGAQAPNVPDSSAALGELQSQLLETQRSLASHVDKIRSLESMLAEHEAIKREVSAMRDMMEERKRDMEHLRGQTQSPTHLRRLESHSDRHSEEYDDDDDARSIATIVPHELERVEEEDEEQIAAAEEEERRQRSEEVRPRTPEPTGMGMDDDEHDADPAHLRPAVTDASPSHAVHDLPPAHPAPSSSIPDDLTQRLTTLENQLESALELSRNLQAQHTTAQSTISMLESKVSTLESLVQATQTQVEAHAETQKQLVDAAEVARNAAQDESPAATIAAAYKAQAEERAKERESLTEMLNEWKKNVEGRWSGVQEEWNDERDRLRRAREEWEARIRTMETGLESTKSKVESSLASLASFQVGQHQSNGHAKLSSNGAGLITPPSPRSLSSDSIRTRQKKRRGSSARGRSRSRSGSPAAPANGGTSASDAHMPEGSSASTSIRRRSWGSDSSRSEPEEHLANGFAKGEVRESPTMQYPITPEPSLLEQPISGSSGVVAALTEPRTKDHPKDSPHMPNVSTAFGIFVLGVAAAAVLWRVKPETSV